MTSEDPLSNIRVDFIVQVLLLTCDWLYPLLVTQIQAKFMCLELDWNFKFTVFVTTKEVRCGWIFYISSCKIIECSEVRTFINNIWLFIKHCMHTVPVRTIGLTLVFSSQVLQFSIFYVFLKKLTWSIDLLRFFLFWNVSDAAVNGPIIFVRPLRFNGFVSG